MTTTIAHGDPAGRAVPAGHGVRWVRQGLEMFATTPAVWAGMAMLFVLVAVLLSIIPFASLLFSVAVPILIGGVLLGCEALRQGRPLELRHLFSGFEQPYIQPLAIVGALYLAATLTVFFPAVVLAVMGAMATAAVGALSPQAGVGVLLLLLTAFAVMLVAGVALSMALWFAPALVVFRGEAPVDALKHSLRAAWRNLPAFLLYAAAMAGIGLLAVSPLLAALFLVAASPDQASAAGPLVFVLFVGTALLVCGAMLVIMPTTWGAMYASYRDVFADDL